ncbi:Plasmodium exported protein, unknown function [Plasmodium vivax]|uniref:Uncharacterized protein n=1 Tax=Plasmodium vivax TaxID=5855 RepID=A0A565A7Q1_PLAVI|nr:Plasmodium exported protein, unknown function [Plasmodium vivax]
MTAMNKSLESRREIDKSLDVRAYRLLAKYGDKNEFQRTILHNKASDARYNHNLRNEKGNKNTYEHLKNDKLNNVDIYLKSYKSRYAKKKGLKKFDCFYEKKLFSLINKLEKHMEKNNLSKNRIKGVLFTKYGLPFILLSLLPILSYALPYWKITTNYEYKKPDGYTLNDNNGSPVDKIPIKITTEDTSLNCILLYISITFILSLIIYTYIKILKYQRIKAGMLK